jgi:hypothetical protein
VSKVFTFLQLKTSDKYILIRVVALMLVIRIGLSVVPFRVLLELLRSWRERQPDRRALDQKSAKRALWGIRLIGPYVPGATCLTQALAALTLLGHFGQPASLRFGIARQEGGELTAHAWVETEGKIVIGNSLHLSHYAILSPINRGRMQERPIRNL